MNLAFDAAKDAANLAKHKLSLADAMLVYESSNKITLRSARHDEDRLMDIAAVDAAGIVLVLVYVVRESAVRAISLRRASTAERRLYEQVREN